MTFKEWFHDYEWSPEKEAWGQSVWNAAQQAEREKYQELIGTAEAIIDRWDRYGVVIGGGPMEKMLRDVLENLKEKAE